MLSDPGLTSLPLSEPPSNPPPLRLDGWLKGRALRGLSERKLDEPSSVIPDSTQWIHSCEEKKGQSTTQSKGEEETVHMRRHSSVASDLCCGVPLKSSVSAQQINSGGCCNRWSSPIKLMEEVAALKESNRKHTRDLRETKKELEDLKVMLPCTESLRHNGPLSWQYSGMDYQPGMISDEPFDIPLLRSNVEILLLYSRDCPQFMKVMQNFRLLLEDVYNLKVYDCFDVSCTEVLKSPEEWFQMLMNRPTLQTVIVMSKSAYIQDKTYQSHVNFRTQIMYKNPSFLDYLFMYGLKYIKQDFSNNVYRRMYPVQIHGFSDGLSLEILPTLYTMYTLPGHLCNLLTAMTVIHHTSIPHEMKKNEDHGTYAVFLKSIEALKDYEKNNESYFEDMLNISMM